MAYYDNYNEKQLKELIKSMEDNENIIFDNNKEETIGFYSDLVRLYKSLIKEKIDLNEYEEAKDLTDELTEIDNFTDYDGLLVLSNNNGMGFTIKKYTEEKEKGIDRQGLIKELDDLCKRLQDDYNGVKEFEQYEEDRLAIYTTIELLEKGI